MSLSVKKAGALSLVVKPQKRGRAHLGYAIGGPFDPVSAARAREFAAGAHSDEVIECTLFGPTLVCEAPLEFAWAGAACDVFVDDRRVQMGERVLCSAGETISISSITDGMRVYLAFRQRLAACVDDVDNVRLERGMRLALHARPLAEQPHGPSLLYRYQNPCTLRVIAHDDATVFHAPAVVSKDSNRRGIRLVRSDASSQPTHALTTTGVMLGTIQRTPDGNLIILGVDSTTTGGYEVVGNVIAADRHLLGQLRPNMTVRFVEVSIDEALALRRESP